MRTTVLGLLILFIGSCSGSNEKKISDLQNQLDSLRTQIEPGFGEMMSGIQQHHIKLWFAGKNQNWKLADYELHEIGEYIDKVKSIKSRRESESVDMIKPSLDSLKAAVGQKSPAAFERGFTLLTRTCNQCHKVTDHEFNVIIIPTAPPFSNQQFKIKS